MDTLAMADWLRALKNINDVQPVLVTLDGGTYQGARYIVSHQYTSSMRAVVNGKHAAGDTYQSTRFELVGLRPLRVNRRTKFCFVFEGADWYISHYYDRTDKTDYHPFGRQFGLSCWDASDGVTIDTYERRPYERAEMTVVTVPNHTNLKD